VKTDFQSAERADFETLPSETLPSVAALFARFPALPRVALSVRQPWAHFIVSGKKDVENRTWKTNFRGAVLIHSSGNMDAIYDEDEEFIARALGVPEFRIDGFQVFVGGIVGVAEVVDCVTSSASPWFSGPFGFVLKNARPLPFVECGGRLGFWPVR